MRRSLLAAALFAVIAIAALAPIRSYDAFWHFASGRWIVEHHALPLSDPLAVASVKTEWIDGEWLWQIAAYGVVHAFGEPSASTLVALLIAAAFALAFFFAARESDAGLTLVVTAVAFAGASDRLGVRPLTAAALFLVLGLGVLARRELVPWKVALLYAAITIGWMNTHPSALLAPIIAAATLLIDWRRWIVPVASAAALFVNPYGWKGVVAPFHLAALVNSGEFVNSEWQMSPLAIFPLLYASFAVVAIWFLAASEKRANAWRFVVFVLLAALSIRYVRNQALYFAALPLLVPPSRKLARNLSIGFAIAAIIPIAWAISITDHHTGVDDERFPVRAVERLRASRLDGPIYNVDQFGGYLEWTFYPQRRVLTDGRNELFAEFIREDAGAHEDSRKWHALLQKYNVDIAVDEYAAPIQMVNAANGEHRVVPQSVARYRQRDWALIAFDDAAMIFARRAAFPPERLAGLEYVTLVPDGPGYGLVTPQLREIAKREIARAKREFGQIRVVEDLERAVEGN